MKLMTMLFLAMAAGATAEDLALSNGKVLKDVTVAEMEADGLKVNTEAGVVRVKFWELAPDVQKRFGYDPVARDRAERKALTAAAKAKAEAAVPAKIVRPEGVRLKGRIVQVTKDGLLVECVSPRYYTTGDERADPDRAEKAYGTFLVIGHPREADVVDNDSIDIDGTEAGVFRFTTVLGAERTVRKVKVVTVVH